MKWTLYTFERTRSRELLVIRPQTVIVPRQSTCFNRKRFVVTTPASRAACPFPMGNPTTCAPLTNQAGRFVEFAKREQASVSCDLRSVEYELEFTIKLNTTCWFSTVGNGRKPLIHRIIMHESCHDDQCIWEIQARKGASLTESVGV